MAYLIYTTVMRESTISFWEYAKLIATYTSQTTEGGTDSILLERGFTQAQIDIMNKKSSRPGIRALNLSLTSGYEELEHEHYNLYYSLFISYENGVMPFEGAPVDQPNKIFDIFDIFRSLKHEREKRELEEQKKQLNKSKGK